MANPSSSPSSLPLSPAAQTQQDLQVAQAAFQAASLKKDSDPLTYEYTRYNYYSKLYGPDWASQEKARIESANLDPIVQRYRNQYDAIDAEYAGQKDIVDAVNSLNQQQSQVKSTIEKQLEYIGDSIDEKQNQINVYKRYIELEGGVGHHHTAASKPATAKIADYFGQFPESFFVALCVLDAMLLFLLGLIYYKKIVATVNEMIARAKAASLFSSFPPAPPPAPVTRTVIPIPGAATLISTTPAAPTTMYGRFRSALSWAWGRILTIWVTITGILGWLWGGISTFFVWLWGYIWWFMQLLGIGGGALGRAAVSNPFRAFLVIAANITVIVFVVLGFVRAS